MRWTTGFFIALGASATERAELAFDLALAHAKMFGRDATDGITGKTVRAAMIRKSENGSGSTGCYGFEQVAQRFRGPRLQTVFRARPRLRRRVATYAGHFTAIAMRDSFQDVVEATVVDARIRRIDERKVTFLKFLCGLVRIRDSCLSAFPGELVTQRFECRFGLNDDVLVPRLHDE